jgi:uncharacterized membrane protein
MHVNVGQNERLLSVAGGLALAYAGLRKMSPGGVLMALTGGALIFRGITGFCPVNVSMDRNTAEADGTHDGIDLDTTITIQQPREEVYRHWRHLENLPQFMHHLSDVRQLDARRSHWIAPVPKTDTEIEWDAELVAEEENRRLAWRSVDDAVVDNAGEVSFDDAPGGRGTEVHVRLSYRPPAGLAGKGMAKLLNPVFEQMIKEDLRRFKHVMEAGEIPTTEGQPAGA